ncbi:MAG TPA: putative nucleotidyltransferase substrate binding domain-containing protein [Acetobacteraceae bacterium]|jgi:CBS domain-containing protein
MPVTLDFSIPPFDCLTPEERRKLGAAADIAFLRPGEVLFREGETPAHLYLIVKGLVSERAGDEVITVRGAGDLVGADALATPTPATAEVRQETIAQLLPRRLLLDLGRANPAFECWFTQRLGERLAARVARDATRGMAPLMMAKVEQAFLHPPVVVPAATPMKDAARRMHDEKATSVLVLRADGSPGILTDADLARAVLVLELPLDTPVEQVASFPAMTIDHDAFLFRAQLLMTRHGVRHMPVRRDGAIIGVLELIDLVGYMSSRSYFVMAEIERAAGIDDLGRAARAIGPLLEALHDTGMKVRAIAELVSDLNRSILRRLFEFLSPPALLANACLVVMGSEGRGEQLARTDQDNALIVADGAEIDDAELRDVCARFTETLLSYGYPRCPGNMMVANPQWAKREAAFRADIDTWLTQPSGEGFLNLAALTDAAAVAGDPLVLDRLRRHLFERIGNAGGFLSHFARPVLQFDTPIGFFHQILLGHGEHAGEIDVKKGGIFPIVHGVRALALERRIEEVNSFARIEALVGAGALERDVAEDLAEALQYLMEIRLRVRLDQDRRGAGADGDNLVRARDLSRLQHDGLRDSLLIAKRFKERVSYHFRLDAF